MATHDHPGAQSRDRMLSFGRVVGSRGGRRLVNPDGSFNAKQKGWGPYEATRLYRLLLTLSWPLFLLFLGLFYLAINVLFALGFFACGPDAVSNVSSNQSLDRFSGVFFFSIQTFATIGYGGMSPQTRPAHILVTLEAFTGLLAYALAAGLLFARFSRPTGRIRFSPNAVIAPYRDSTALQLRLIAQIEVVEAQARLLFTHSRPEGGREFIPLRLERDFVVFLPLAWTLVHPIDEDSPLRGRTQADLSASGVEILVLVTAYDEAFGQTFHSRTSYLAEDLIWNARFSNMFDPPDLDGTLFIDVNRLNDVEPGESG